MSDEVSRRRSQRHARSRSRLSSALSTARLRIVLACLFAATRCLRSLTDSSGLLKNISNLTQTLTACRLRWGVCLATRKNDLLSRCGLAQNAVEPTVHALDLPVLVR